MKEEIRDDAEAWANNEVVINSFAIACVGLHNLSVLERPSMRKSSRRLVICDVCACLLVLDERRA